MGNSCEAPPLQYASYYSDALSNSVNDKVWEGTVKVHVPPNPERSILIRAFNDWAKVIDREDLFVLVENGRDADIRCQFSRGQGSWSYVGTDAKSITRSRPTLNIGWSIASDYATALHEVGHAIGMGHEHSNPNSKLRFDVGRTYQYFGGAPNNWSVATVQSQIFSKWNFNTDKVWDPKSIMHYSFPGRIINSPSPYNSLGVPASRALSAGDKSWAVAAYSVENIEVVEPVEPEVVSGWFINAGDATWEAADISNPVAGGIYTYVPE